ncbi:hypothetical protein K7432_018439 [Basidiobolus ranarum]|uniref:Uncharacterized protein n=1 Tax=Basidiobolus ranarum TaxID=34480 RepID=A0ABR2VJ00_9FUNG
MRFHISTAIPSLLLAYSLQVSARQAVSSTSVMNLPTIPLPQTSRSLSVTNSRIVFSSASALSTSEVPVDTRQAASSTSVMDLPTIPLPQTSRSSSVANSDIVSSSASALSTSKVSIVPTSASILTDDNDNASTMVHPSSSVTHHTTMTGNDTKCKTGHRHSSRTSDAISSHTSTTTGQTSPATSTQSSLPSASVTSSINPSPIGRPNERRCREGKYVCPDGTGGEFLWCVFGKWARQRCQPGMDCSKPPKQVMWCEPRSD